MTSIDSPVLGSRRVWRLLDNQTPLIRFLDGSDWARRRGIAEANDFVVGNPHEMPLPAFAEALQRWSVPRDKDWFAYKQSEPTARETVVRSLNARPDGVAFDVDDVHMSNGAFGGLTSALLALTDPGDEVIYNSPPWFFYETIIGAGGGVPVRVRVDPDSFDLDLAAIEDAISPRTRVVIVNSPNNPSGRIYPAETLRQLADLLTRASARIGHPIFIVSDEAYYRIVFDGRVCPSPTSFYPHTLLVYTYGKTLLTPGERLGYCAFPATLPLAERQALRQAFFMAQVVSGYAFPNAVLQHALADLDRLSVDIDHLQRKRDLLVSGLRSAGYELTAPEGTFYLLPRSPLEDDMAFVGLLAERNVFVLPGCLVEMPGYFRISITANDQMIERGLPGFADALQAARRRGR